MQTMVYQNYGPMNGLVSLTNIRNTRRPAGGDRRSQR